MTRKKLVVVADDFGESKDVNSRIISSFLDGIVTTASIFVGMPFTDDGVKRAKDVGLSLGLHLRLTEGPPLTKGPIDFGLCNGGEFLPPLQLLKRLMIGGSDFVNVIRDEIRAQMDAFLKYIEKPEHINTHHHIHIHPLILKPLLAVANDYNFPVLRWPTEPVLGKGKLKREIEIITFNILAFYGEKTLNKSGMKSPDHFRGLRLMDGEINSTTLCDTIKNVQDGITELMVHPGNSYNGEKEIKAICNSNVRNVLSENNISLVTFGDAF